MISKTEPINNTGNRIHIQPAGDDDAQHNRDTFTAKRRFVSPCGARNPFREYPAADNSGESSGIVVIKRTFYIINVNDIIRLPCDSNFAVTQRGMTGYNEIR